MDIVTSCDDTWLGFLSSTYRAPPESRARDTESQTILETQEFIGQALRLDLDKSLDGRGEEAAATPEPNWFLRAFADSRRIYSEAIVATIAINILALAMPLRPQARTFHSLF